MPTFEKLAVVIPVGPKDEIPDALCQELIAELPGAEIVIAPGQRFQSKTPGVGVVSSDWGRAKQLNAGGIAVTPEFDIAHCA